MQKIRSLKQSHERWMIAILGCDVFPGLELNDPATSKSEDLVPEKYGSKWYEH